MPSSYTPLLRVELQAAGENRTSWGSRGNRSIQRLEDGAIGAAMVVMSNQDYTLSTAYGTADEARMVNIIVSGTLTQDRNLIIPTSSKFYNIYNDTSGGFDVIVTNGINSVPIKTEAHTSIFTDGYNVFPDTDAEDYVQNAAPGISPISSYGYQRIRSGFTIQWAKLATTGLTGPISGIPYAIPYINSSSNFITCVSGKKVALGSTSATAYSVVSYETNKVFQTDVSVFSVGITE